MNDLHRRVGWNVSLVLVSCIGAAVACASENNGETDSDVSLGSGGRLASGDGDAPAGGAASGGESGSGVAGSNSAGGAIEGSGGGAVAPSGALKVFILAGQSNMAGRGTVEGEADEGTLEYVVANEPDEWGHLKDAGGDWVVRDDVWIWCKRTNKFLSGNIAEPLEGPLTIRQGFDERYIGPELTFGNVIGDHFEEQVLILKHAWGGTALGHEWYSPSQPGYQDPNCCDGSNMENAGFYYQLMLQEIDSVLGDIGAVFPEYDETKGYEIVGFGWHQGFNDQFDGHDATYEANLARFIGDVRQDLGIAELPVVIGASEHSGGTVANTIRPAQLSLGDPEQYPQFAGNLVTTGGSLLQPRSESPSGDGSHYFFNAKTYLLIGDAMGKGMIDLLSD